jgi:hypothetical protein
VWLVFKNEAAASTLLPFRRGSIYYKWNPSLSTALLPEQFVTYRGKKPKVKPDLARKTAV